MMPMSWIRLCGRLVWLVFSAVGVSRIRVVGVRVAVSLAGDFLFFFWVSLPLMGVFL